MVVDTVSQNQTLGDAAPPSSSHSTLGVRVACSARSPAVEPKREAPRKTAPGREVLCEDVLEALP